MSWKKIFVKKQQAANTVCATTAPASIKAVVRTDPGNIRPNNEDTGLFFRVADDAVISKKGCLLIVADGMGGHQAGEVASKMAADIISRQYFKTNGNTEKNLEDVFAMANKTIFETASADKTLRGMGTTCTALVIADSNIYYAHAGDSRAYILKNNTIARITSDHTYVQELVKKGEITIAEAAAHPQRNILTNAMGTKPRIRIDTGKCDFQFEEKDRLLLCTDGLYDYLDDNEIADIVYSNPLEEAAEYLVAEAKKRGGHDNITVVLAEKNTETTVRPSKETRDFILPITKEIELP